MSRSRTLPAGDAGSTSDSDEGTDSIEDIDTASGEGEDSSCDVQEVVRHKHVRTGVPYSGDADGTLDSVQGKYSLEQTDQGRDAAHADADRSVEVCVVTWNLAEKSPQAKDVQFLKRVAATSDLVAVGVQEIENLKPRRNEGGRTREWRHLLNRRAGLTLSHRHVEATRP